MPWSLFDIVMSLPAYALVLFRLTGLALTAPIYGSSQIPLRLRGAAVIAIAALILPTVRAQVPADLTLTGVLVGGVGELFVGLSIGLSLAMFVTSAEVGGLVVGRQAGIALTEVFDPTSGQRSTISGQLYTIVLMLVFLVAGGHRATMAALLDTYNVIPLMSFHLDDSIALLFVEMLTAAFILGLRLAGPVLIALFLTGTALGFLSRTMPQMNILSVGFTFRVLVAIAIAGLALTAYQGILVDATWDAFETVRAAFGLVPGDTRLVS